MAYEFKINLETLLQKNNVEIDAYKFQKMVIIYNAINDGWTVRKNGDLYVFKKPHQGQQEIFNEHYLERFIQKNTNYL
jgi:hypothetical protein